MATVGFSRGKNRRRIDAPKAATERVEFARRLLPAVGQVLLVAALVALLVAGGSYAYRWSLHAPTFAITTIRFHGLERATEGDLLKLAGLAFGQNLLSLDVLALERGLRSHPWVKSAKLRRRPPAAVEIEIVEYEPAAVLSLGDLYLVDTDGRPFKRVQTEDALDLPIVTGIERDAYVNGADAAAGRVRHGLEAARAFLASEAGRGTALSEVRLAHDAVTLVDAEGRVVALGERTDAAQLARVATVRRELSRRGLHAAVIYADNRARPGWVAVELATRESERSGSQGK